MPLVVKSIIPVVPIQPIFVFNVILNNLTTLIILIFCNISPVLSYLTISNFSSRLMNAITIGII
jgi:hypothetical protein